VIDADTINIVAGAVGTVIPVVIGFLVSHKVVSKRSLTKAYSYAVFAASAAEELYATDTVGGAVKRQYALDRILDKTGLSEADAEMLLHAAVNGLRASGLKPRKAAPAQLASVPPPAAPAA
jgi:hypothetical protein